MERILQTDVFMVENEQQVFAAIVEFREGRGSFADALIVRSASERAVPLA